MKAAPYIAALLTALMYSDDWVLLDIAATFCCLYLTILLAVACCDGKRSGHLYEDVE